MFLPFFAALRGHGVPVTLAEFLAFLEGLGRGLATLDTEAFYDLARLTMVKDERHLDRFDQAFRASFAGLGTLAPAAVLAALELPAEWLRKLAERHLTEEERRAVAALGGFEALMATLRQRLAEQEGRHQGGPKWIGTAGTSPFGAWGYNPEGVRIGQTGGRQGRAVKVWDRREFRDLDDRVELGARAMKLALRRLRRFAREGAALELDLPGTIRATAEQGWLDLRTRPERRNAVRLLLFLDVGGSMEPHVRRVEELFSAARAEFRTLEAFYFHNCLYEGVWRENRRRWEARTPTADLLAGYGPAWKCVFVGDATMSPYEITEAGGANEHWNPEPGRLWLERARTAWPATVWINPTPEEHWPAIPSVGLVRGILEGRMFPLTLAGLDAAMAALR
ncbi:MAG: VWA domain-containing protein [Rhodobacteraceae bacterium]|nr:VWA domain-containing protein [Paracoccaceae bacterium]